MKVAAVIFDLDGTVLDNEDEYGLAFKKVLESLGARDIPDYPQVGGIGVRENWPILLKKYNLTTDKSVEDLDHLTHQEYFKLVPRVTFREGVERLMRQLKENGVKLALSTSSIESVVDEISKYLALEDYFDGNVTTGEEVPRKKPAPDLFLLSASKVGVAPDQCLVIEDSAAGVEAAHMAGMKVIGIALSESQKEVLGGADLVIERFSEITKAAIDQL